MGDDQRVKGLTQVAWETEDFVRGEAIARTLGYEQFAYTSTSALWGLFCLPENPRTWRGARQALEGGCIIKTRELGFLFVQDGEDRHFGVGWEDVTRDVVARRLEELRVVLRSESMSYGELAELQGLAAFIDKDDVELLEAAGVPEFPDDVPDGAVV